MSDLPALIEEYLAFRLARGFQPSQKLARSLRQFAASVPSHDGGVVFDQADALRWANAPARAKDAWRATRLSMVRQLAIYVSGSGLPVQIPSGKQGPAARARAVPFIYTPDEIDALLHSATGLFTVLRAATMRTLIGLLAVTGMRIGEALRIEIDDLDIERGALLIKHAKLERQRVNCLDLTACEALTAYLTLPQRNRLGVGGDRPLFTTGAGSAVGIGTISAAFQAMRAHAGLQPRAGARPRLHDFRHTFATRTMIDAYESGRDPAAALAALAIWLGHTSPAYTYWYLQAIPELAAIAARRLEPDDGRNS